MPGEVLHVASTPATAAGAPLAVWSAQHLYVSRDGGASFAAVPLPSGDTVTAAAYGDGAFGIAVARHDAAGALHSALLSSTNGGQSFQPVAGLPSPSVELDAVAMFGGRTLVGLATPDPQGQEGLRCSTDAGRSWAASC